MRWDHRLSIPTATTDADPIATPANVPQERVFRLNEREAINSILSGRLIIGLHAPAAENLSFTLYALDSADEDAAIAAMRWSAVLVAGPLAGGAVLETTGAAAQGFVGGGVFYFRVTTNNLTTTREALFRATV